MLIFLSIVTTIEVALGIIKPEILMGSLFTNEISKLDFYHLNHSKAYYIAWDFMHIRDERSG